VVLSYKFNDRVDVSATWVFSTGNTATLATQRYPVASEDPDDYDTGNGHTTGSLTSFEGRNNYRMPNYHRMDVSINFHKKLRRGQRTINISVYNVYNHQNPYLVYESYQWSALDNNGIKVLKQLSIFPILPSISYTWKF
jgi:hypothetical protein